MLYFPLFISNAGGSVVKSRITTRTLIETAVFAAVMCVLAPLSVPVGAVPVSLATFALYLAGGLQKPLHAVASVCIYVLLGIVGIPVFAGFMGGVERLLAPAGGFIVGYIPCVFIISFILCKKRVHYMYPVAMICGTVVLYACGLLWFMISMKQTFISALTITVVPFLLTDAAKTAAASVVCCTVYGRIAGMRDGVNR